MPIVDSKQSQLDVPAIIENAASVDTDPDASISQIISMYIKELEDPNGKFYRYGNTIFVIHGSAKNPGVGIFRAINADTAENYLQSSYQFATDAYEDGFWLLTTKFSDASLLNLFRIIMANPPRKGMGYAVKKTKEGRFQVNLTLGPRHEVEGSSMSQEVPLQGMPEPTMPPQSAMPPQSMPPQGALQQLNKPQRMIGGQ
jgi:hypothetical protein